VPVEQVYFTLEKLFDIHSYIPQVGFFLFDEPTTHPRFFDIMERAGELDLIGEQHFLATNGSILAKASEDTWSRLKQTGISYLQYTFYGNEAVHDEFAGRRGAFRNLETAIEKSIDHGMEWVAGVILHSNNIHEIIETISYIKGLDDSGNARVGWFPFMWQGRGRDADRVSRTEYERWIPEDVRSRKTQLMDERSAIDLIMNEPELANRKPTDNTCINLTVNIDRDLNVFCGGACDSGGIASAVPELSDAFKLGTLEETGFEPLLDTFLKGKWAGFTPLESITWGELADRYGNRNNDEMYWVFDLPLNKWAALHLQKSMNR
jgi:MoaA/NifB/PqqE/SkfB family radical SAM enzyme